MQINPPDDWLKDRMDTGLTSTHTACRFSVLYHAFPPKPCILCSFVLFFWLPSCATSMPQDFRPSLGAQFSLTTSLMCRTIVVGLIYTTRSTVKSWRILVAHDSRKQKSHGSFRLLPRSLASSRGCLFAIETLRWLDPVFLGGTILLWSSLVSPPLLLSLV